MEDENYDPTDMGTAFARCQEFGPRIPLGVFYKNDRPTYEESDPVLMGPPMIDRELEMSREMFDDLLSEMM